MPKYRVKTNQGTYEVSLSGEPESAEQLQELVSQQLSQDQDAQDQGGSTFLRSPKGETYLKQEKPIRKMASSFYTPLLEMIGLGGGALAGGPIAGIAASAGGYAGMKNLAKNIDYATGLYDRPKSKGIVGDIKSVSSQTGKDIIEGAQTEMLGQAAGKAIISPLQKMMAPMAERVSKLPSIDQMGIDIARTEGIPLSPAEYSKSLPLRLSETVLRTNPAAAGRMEASEGAQLNAYEKFAERVQRSIGRPSRIEDLGKSIQGKVGEKIAVKEAMKTSAAIKTADKLRGGLLGGREVMGEEISGMKVKGNLGQESRKVFHKLSDEYSNLPISGETKIPTQSLKDTAVRLLKDYKESPAVDKEVVNILKSFVAKEPGKAVEKGGTSELEQMLSMSPDVLGRNPELAAELEGKEIPSASWEHIVKRVRPFLNRLMTKEDQAIKHGGEGYAFLSSPEGGMAKALKSALDEDIKAYSKSQGGNLSEEFYKTTAKYAESARLYGHKDVKTALTQNPEKIVRSVFRPGNITAIKKLKSATDKETFQIAKDKFTDTLLKGKDLKSALNKYGDETLNAIYGKKEFSLIKKMADRRAGIEGQEVVPLFAKKLLSKNPEDVFDYIIKSAGRKSIERVDAENINMLTHLEGYISKKESGQLGAKFAERLMADNKHGRLSPRQFIETMDSFGRDTGKKLLGADGYKEMVRLAKVSEVVAGAERASRGPALSAQSFQSVGMLGGLYYAPLATIGYGLTSNGLARIYTSSMGRKYLSEGFKMKVGTEASIRLASKIVALVGSKGLTKIQDKKPAREVDKLFKVGATP